MTNDVVAAGAGVTEQWIVHRTGVHERRYVSDGRAAAGPRRPRPAGSALEEAGVGAEDLDLVLVATLAADELTPNCAPLVAHDLGAAERRRDGRERRLHRLPVGALARHRAGRGRTRRQRPRDRRRRAEPLRRPAPTAAPRPCSPTAPARRWSSPPPTATAAASATSSCTATAAARTSIRRLHEEQRIRMQGHDTFKAAVQRMSEATLEAAQLAGLEARRHRPVRLPPGERPHPAPRSASGSASTTSA